MVLSLVATLNKCEFFDLLVEIATKRADHIEKDQAEKIRKENRVLDAKARQTARMEYQVSKGGERVGIIKFNSLACAVFPHLCAVFLHLCAMGFFN